MRRSLGTAVFSGMMASPCSAVFLTPVFFFVLTRSGEAKQARTELPAAVAAGQPTRLATRRLTFDPRRQTGISALETDSAGLPFHGELKPGRS